MTSFQTAWKPALSLDHQRQPTAGSEQALNAAIQNGADLRIYTQFYHHEHLVPGSDNHELVEEVSEFRVTCLLEKRWSAGIMTLRQPIEPPFGFGPRPSMSFFMYNQNGQQAIARPFLDGLPPTGKTGPAPLENHPEMPRYEQLDNWDAGTNAPAHNFVYHFESYRFFVRDDWQEVLNHNAQGEVLSGSLASFMEAFRQGCEIKVGISGLGDDLTTAGNGALPHEVFVQTGPGYYHTQSDLFSAGTHPVVRVRPAIPLVYESGNWDFGWLMPRTDGFLARLLVDPQTQQFHKSESRHAMRWFVR